MSKLDTNNEIIRRISQFFIEKGEKADEAAENVNGFYGAYTVTVHYAQFWFRRLPSGNLKIMDFFLLGLIYGLMGVNFFGFGRKSSMILVKLN